MNTSSSVYIFGKKKQVLIGEKILYFRNRSYSGASGKYQNMEKPLKHQRRLGLSDSMRVIRG